MFPVKKMNKLRRHGKERYLLCVRICYLAPNRELFSYHSKKHPALSSSRSMGTLCLSALKAEGLLAAVKLPLQPTAPVHKL